MRENSKILENNEQEPIPSNDIAINVQKNSEAEQNPEEKLNKLKEDLKEIQRNKNELTKKEQNTIGDMATLEKIVSEVKQLLDSYDQSSKNLAEEKKDLEDYYEKKRPMIEATIGEKKDEIEKIIDEYDQKIAETEEIISERGKEYKDAYEQYQAAKRVMEEKQKAYGSLKTYEQSVKNRLKELTGLKEKIEKEEDSRNMGNMYFLITELKSILEETKIVSKEDVKKDLNQAGNELDSARGDLREKKDRSESAAENLQEKQSELESLKKNRRDEILKRVGEIST